MGFQRAYKARLPFLRKSCLYEVKNKFQCKEFQCKEGDTIWQDL